MRRAGLSASAELLVFIFLVNIYNILTRSFFAAQNPNIVRRLGSSQTRWASLQRSPDPSWVQGA